MMDTDKAALIIECERLQNFLENNQLVQANAIVQKLEAMLNAQLLKLASKPEAIESHPYWLPFRSSMRIKRDILSGKTKEAETETSGLARMLRSANSSSPLVTGDVK
jgi:hypothetical protein